MKAVNSWKKRSCHHEELRIGMQWLIGDREWSTIEVICYPPSEPDSVCIIGLDRQNLGLVLRIRSLYFDFTIREIRTDVNIPRLPKTGLKSKYSFVYEDCYIRDLKVGDTYRFSPQGHRGRWGVIKTIERDPKSHDHLLITSLDYTTWAKDGLYTRKRHEAAITQTRKIK